MRKKEERQIMRQKVNVSDVLIESWKANYLHDIRNLIHPSLMEKEDLGKTFEHQGRTFEIVGMSTGGTLMVRETREEGIFYWECTRQFVQMKLQRFNKEFYKLLGKLQTRMISYPENKLFLAPLNKRAKKEEEEVIDDRYDGNEDDDSPAMVSYSDDNYDDETED
jgi:hypothetical protein